MKKFPDPFVTVYGVDWPDVMPVLREAIMLQARPKNHRVSEYAMTKAAAHRSFTKVQSAVMLNEPPGLRWFDWQVLLSELARLWLASKKDDKKADHVLNVHEHIRRHLSNDPKTQELVMQLEAIQKLTREHDKARRKSRKAKRRIDKRTQQLSKQIEDLADAAVRTENAQLEDENREDPRNGFTADMHKVYP